MNVVFQTPSKDQNRFTMEVEGHGRIYFQKGAYITSDKDLIKKLMSHTLKKRGNYRLKTNKDKVVNYLEGNEPDRLTEEILENISLDGLVEIGEALNSTENKPGLIKYEVVGEPITTQVQNIIDVYQRKKNRKQVKEEVKVEEKQVQELSTKKSGDLTASKAIKYIESTSSDQLTDFLSDDESRVTVTRAWNDKVNN